MHHQIHSLHQGSLDLSSAYHTQTLALWEELTNVQPPGKTVEDLLGEKETNRVIDFVWDSMRTMRTFTVVFS